MEKKPRKKQKQRLLKKRNLNVDNVKRQRLQQTKNLEIIAKANGIMLI